MFGNLLKVVGSWNGLPDELLDLVDHQQRAGELRTLSKDASNKVECVGNGRRTVVFELVSDGGLGVGVVVRRVTRGVLDAEVLLADLAREDRDSKITEVFVVSNATTGEVEVWFRYNCDIQLLNKYSPFHACLRDGNFSPVAVKDHAIEIGEPILRRSMRKEIGRHGFTVALA